MKKSKKIGLYVIAGVVVTIVQVIKRFCKIRAREGGKKLFIVIDNAFDFIGNCIENIMAASLIIGMFI